MIPEAMPFNVGPSILEQQFTTRVSNVLGEIHLSGCELSNGFHLTASARSLQSLGA